MQSVITSTFAAVFFSHSIEFDRINEKSYFLLYEPYMANYSVKVIANLNLVQDMIHGYDSEWDITRTSERKEPLILLATGLMKQQPTVRAFLGRVVEEKFYMQAFALTIIPGIPFVPERLKELIHPEVAPVQLGEDSTENDEPRSYNPYYTDEDEPYVPPEYPSYVRRMSDSSSDANTEKHYDQHVGGFPEDMLRYAESSGSEKNYYAIIAADSDHLGNQHKGNPFKS
ncbi:hypothetical protein G6F36_014153 [Rhizopus arrhizus]|nr:hypothetical protein G6F36_014153 [Rhizopus arrhizus]